MKKYIFYTVLALMCIFNTSAIAGYTNTVNLQTQVTDVLQPPHGGSGLNALGPAGYYVAMNGTGTGWTYTAGTGTAPAMTIGDVVVGATEASVLFAGTGGVLAQDNTNFTWNNTTKTLSIGGSLTLTTPLAVAYGGTGTNTGIGGIEEKTATYTVNANDTAKRFTNTGATAPIIFNLPDANAGLNYCFIADAAYVITVKANAGDTIRNVHTVSTSGGTFVSDGTIGPLVCIFALNSSEWFVDKLFGTWTVN